MTDIDLEKFAADSRYGRYVQIMKVILPAACAAVLIVLMFAPLFTEANNGFTLDFSQLDEFDDTVRMVAPNYSGTDDRGRRFEIVAQSAYQGAPDGKHIHLDLLTADVAMPSGGWVALDSAGGAYQPDAQIVDLAGQVNIFSDIGYEAHSRTMRLDLNLGVATSHENVNGQGPFGVFESGGMEVDLNGEYVYLTDGVTMTVYPRLLNEQGGNSGS